VATNSLWVKNVEIPTSSHPEIKKLKRKTKVHNLHGNKIWDSSMVIIESLDEMDIINNKILDLGCGWGALTHYLQSKGAYAVGMDADKNVKPYFDLMSSLMNVKPKFILQDIFSKPLRLDFDTYIAVDVCFWNIHTDLWINLIKYLNNNDKQLIMVDPGRESFWELLDKISDGKHDVCFHYQRLHINKPKKTDAYIVIFGE
tara:strand:+ start:770 stop:1372 length:603 start_codon:yes stop_codon:yes gene_type:complete